MEKTNHARPNFFSYIAALTFALLSCLLALPAAAESAGIILAFKGKVEIFHGTEKRPIAIRAELLSGDTLVTGDGQVQIRFADGTLLSLYHDTKFAVDDYHYGRGQGDRAQFTLVNGVMHTLTGNIDKSSYLLKTRLANLGVRGTEYSAKLDSTLHVSVDQGRVELANSGGSIIVNAGQSAIVVGPDVMPKPAMGGRLDLGMHGGGHGGPGGGAGGPPSGGGSAPPPPPPAGTAKF